MQTELKLKLSIVSVFFKVKHGAFKGRYIPSNAFNGNRSVHLLNYIFFVVVIVVIVFLKNVHCIQPSLLSNPEEMQVYVDL